MDTRTIGRDLEMLKLQDLYGDVVDDVSPRVFTIIGDAGVGKSRLPRELDQWLAEIPDPVWWFRGRASPSAQNLPNALLREMMAARLDIHESDDPETVRLKWEEGMATMFGAGSEGRAHLVAHWLGFEIGDTPHVRGVRHDPQGLHDRARSYLTEYFADLVGESPVVVLLEDLHWADEGSLRWFDSAGHLLAGRVVLVVATKRPSLFERYPTWGESGDVHTRIPLDSLSRRQSRQLLGEILQKAEHVPEALIELVVDATDGNPFYIEELVKWMLEAGVIEKDDDRWTVHEQKIDRTRVPATLRGVLQARLDTLAHDERQALQQAAVIGRVFWDDAVEGSCRRDGSEQSAGGDVARSAPLTRGRLRTAAVDLRRHEGVPLQARLAARRDL
ncbi:MAG TPA: AAA family ATPase [Acidimicrobiia bacterium]|nr:AAA family ATPase [Acidimicrobiia bacterium]